MSVKPFATIALLTAVMAWMLFTGCGSLDENEQSPVAAQTETPTQPKVYDGEESFQNRCAVCHGEFADGTAAGPPLVDRLYEIGHHPNFSFHNAVNNGVTAHHWNFGDMPPIPNVDTAEIDVIICHVRDLQRAQGIAAGEPC